MSQSDGSLTRADLKSAVAEALRENHDWFRELVRESIEDIAREEAEFQADARAALADPRVALPPVRGIA
jgi:hypothetical protein